MRNSPAPTTAQELIEALETLLSSRLPSDWSVAVQREPRLATREAWRPDAVLSIQAPNQDGARIAVEIKTRLYPRDTYALSRELGSPESGTPLPKSREGTRNSFSGVLVMTRYLTERTSLMLERLGFSYADATGNLRIALRQPPLFIELTGADANPWTEARPLRSLRGPGSARVVRALIDFQPPYPLRALAEVGDLPLGTASRVVSYLVDEALVNRTGRGPIEQVDWKGILKRWAEDYTLLETNRSRLFLEPRGPRALLERLPDLGMRYAITGSLAAVLRAPVAPPALAVVYVLNIDKSAQRLRLPSAPDGGNVVLLEPHSDVAFERTWVQNNLTYASLSQVAVDLLTSPGRGPAEAEALVEWMEANEDDWRRPGSRSR